MYLCLEEPRLGEIVAPGPVSAENAQDRFIEFLEQLSTNLVPHRLADFGIHRGDIDRIIAKSDSKYNQILLNHIDFTEILHDRL